MKKKLNKKVLVINRLYILLVLINLALTSYPLITYHLWARGLLEGSPYIFNMRTVLALSALTLPMIVVCILFYKHNKISTQRHKFFKGFTIWLPLIINLNNLLVLFEFILMGLIF